jgi:general stress protein 26
MFRLLIVLLVSLALQSQEPAAPGPKGPPPNPLEIAKELQSRVRYCTLVTLDEKGAPDARVMDAFPMEADGSLWLATKAGSRKVAQIRKDPRVTLLWLEANTQSYATFAGTATLVDDPAEKLKRWKEAWAKFYDDGPRGADYLLIRVRPFRLEIVSPSRGLMNDPKTWKPVTVALGK